MDLTVLQLAKNYTDATAAGMGAVQGAACTIQSIEPITGGNRVTFAWEDNEGVTHTDTMDVMDGSKGDKGDTGEKGEKGEKGDDGMATRNIITVAHRGYYTDGTPDNTYEAILNAAEMGFEWCEIDIRQTSDGVLILSHGDTKTMYSNGSPVSVTFSTSNYSSIKDYTWDSEGLYKLAVFDKLLGKLRPYAIKLLCDTSVDNAVIMNIANRNGMANSIVLSYFNISQLLSDASLLAQYPNTAVRVIPNTSGGYSSYMSVRNTIKTNPIYLDIAMIGNDTGKYLPIAFNMGFPIIASQCDTASQYKDRYLPIASGIMANENVYSVNDIIDMVSDIDYDQNSVITPSSASVSVASGGTVVVTASATGDGVACNIFGYVDSGSVSVHQDTFGRSVQFTITGGESVSTCTLHLFNGCGATASVTITPSQSEWTDADTNFLLHKLIFNQGGNYAQILDNKATRCAMLSDTTDTIPNRVVNGYNAIQVSSNDANTIRIYGETGTAVIPCLLTAIENNRFSMVELTPAIDIPANDGYVDYDISGYTFDRLGITITHSGGSGNIPDTVDSSKFKLQYK